MSADSKYFEYVLPTGVVASIITVLLVMVAIVSAGTLTFGQVFSPVPMLFTLIVICVVFVALSYGGHHARIEEKIRSQEGILLYIALVVFVSIELFNIMQSVATGATYYPSNSEFIPNFWTSRIINLAISGISTIVVGYLNKSKFPK